MPIRRPAANAAKYIDDAIDPDDLTTPEEDDEETPAPPRKRAPAKKKPAPAPVEEDEAEDNDYYAEDEDDEEDEPAPPPVKKRAPAKKKPAPAPVEDEDEDDEDAAPAPRRRQAAAPAKKAAPAKRRRPVDDDDDEFEDEDEDEQPKFGTSMQSGWDGAEAVRKSAPSEYTNELQWTEEPQLIKFLSNGPFVSFLQHWVDNNPVTKKKSFVCLVSIGGKSCPLCDVGNKPSARYAFSVATIDESPSEAQMIVAGNQLFATLKAKNEGKRTGPLTKHFYEVSKVPGAGNKSATFNIEVIRAADIAEEYSLDVADINAALAEIEPLTGDDITVTPLAELRKIARSIA